MLQKEFDCLYASGVLASEVQGSPSLVINSLKIERRVTLVKEEFQGWKASCRPARNHEGCVLLVIAVIEVEAIGALEVPQHDAGVTLSDGSFKIFGDHVS